MISTGYCMSTYIIWNMPRPMMYPLVMTSVAIGNGPVEIVDLPSYKMGGFSSSLFVCLPGRVSHRCMMHPWRSNHQGPVIFHSGSPMGSGRKHLASGCAFFLGCAWFSSWLGTGDWGFNQQKQGRNSCGAGSHMLHVVMEYVSTFTAKITQM